MSIAAIPGPYKSAYGPTLDANCFAGLTFYEQQQSIRHFEEIATLVIQQGSWCESTLRLPGIDRALELFKKIHISCTKEPNDNVLSAQLNVEKGWQPFIRPFQIFNHGLFVSADYEQRYVVTVPKLFLFARPDWGYWLTDYEDLPHWAAMVLAAGIFHELIHFTEQNNRSWHNDVESIFGEPNPDSCEMKESSPKSLFEDRVFLISSACFPVSYYGGAFLYSLRDESGPLANPQCMVPCQFKRRNDPHDVMCSRTCIKAFTEVDSKVIGQTYETSGNSKTWGTIGRLPVAKPETIEQAEFYCRRIQDLNQRILWLRDVRAKAEAVIEQTRSYFHNSKGIEDELDNIKGAVDRYYQRWDYDSEQALSDVRKSKSKLAEVARYLCKNAPNFHASIRPYCIEAIMLKSPGKKLPNPSKPIFLTDEELEAMTLFNFFPAVEAAVQTRLPIDKGFLPLLRRVEFLGKDQTKFVF